MSCARRVSRSRNSTGVTVRYDGIVAGEYAVDLLVEGTLVVELKASKALDAAHTAQCLNYLKATGLRLCLLLDFGKSRLQIRRLSAVLEGGNAYQCASVAEIPCFPCRIGGRLIPESREGT